GGRGDAPLCRLSAQVDASNPRSRAHSRRSRTGRRGGRHPRTRASRAMTGPVSLWSALGNRYLVVGTSAPDRPLTPASVRELSREADGIVEVVSADASEVEVVIWNRDGTTAELSGNGTRIAARWLAERTAAASVVVRVGGREVAARMLEGVEVETEMG